MSRAGVTDWAIAGTFTLIGLLVRWRGLTRQSLWTDEMSSFWFAHLPVLDLLRQVIHFDTTPPLYYLVGHFAYSRLGFGTIDTVRMPSLVAGTISIAIIYGLGRLLVGRLAGAIAAAIVAVSPMAVWYSREGRQYALVWCLVLLSYLLLIQAARARRLIWPVFYGVSIALALWTHYSAVLGLAPQAALIAWKLVKGRGSTQLEAGATERGEVRVWQRLALAYVGGWLLFTPWLAELPKQLPVIRQVPHGQPDLATALALLLNVTGVWASQAQVSLLSPPVAGILLTAYLTTGLITVGLLIKGQHRFFAETVTTFLAGLALMSLGFVALGSYSVLMPRVVGIAAFGLALMAGGAVAVLWRLTRAAASRRQAESRKALLSQAVPMVMFAALLLALIGGTGQALAALEATGSNGESWDKVAAVLVQRGEPGDQLIYYPYGLKVMVDAYLPPKSPWLGRGVGIWQAPEPIAQTYFANWVGGHPRVWMVFYASTGVHMPTHDLWMRTQGFCRLSGEPNLQMGILEYGPCR